MKSSLSQLLIKEHDIILKAGEFIGLQKNLWLNSPGEYEQKIKQLLDLFSVYADEYHHMKEEEILFPAIGKKHELVSGGIVQELIEHHEYFRILISKIKTALDEKEFARAQLLLETYTSILKDHIAIENDELFPMAEDIFSKAELENLYYKCIDKDRELGIIYKEELEKCINKLQKNETVQ